MMATHSERLPSKRSFRASSMEVSTPFRTSPSAFATELLRRLMMKQSIDRLGRTCRSPPVGARAVQGCFQPSYCRATRSRTNQVRDTRFFGPSYPVHTPNKLRSASR